MLALLIAAGATGLFFLLGCALAAGDVLLEENENKNDPPGESGRAAQG